MPFARDLVLLMYVCVCLVWIGGAHGGCGMSDVDEVVATSNVDPEAHDLVRPPSLKLKFIPECPFNDEPEWPSQSPARLAATFYDKVEDVVQDFFNQFPKLDPSGEAEEDSEEHETIERLSQASLPKKRPDLSLKGIDGLMAALDEDSTDSTDSTDTDSAANKGSDRKGQVLESGRERVSILLHSSKRVSKGRLSEVRDALVRTNKFARVIVLLSDAELVEGNQVAALQTLDSQIPGGEDKEVILFTDSIPMVHWARRDKSYFPSMYEGYLFGAPQIASGLRLFAALQKRVRVESDPTWGTHYPGGVDWFQARKIIAEAEGVIAAKVGLEPVITAKAAIQGILTTTYVPMEELLNGIKNVLMFIERQIEAGGENTGWVLWFDDKPNKSNCWMAKIINKLVKESRLLSKSPVFVASEQTSSMFDDWEGPLPERVIVLAIDDNTCSGNQLAHFLDKNLNNVFKSQQVPKRVHVIMAPLFSTGRAVNHISKVFTQLVGSSGLKETTKKYEDKQLDTSRHFTVNEKLELSIIQYVELESVFRKVFVGEPGTDNESRTDPRGRYRDQSAFAILNYGTYEDTNEQVLTGYLDKTVADGKISTAFDWKIVDRVSMPLDLTFGITENLIEETTMNQIENLGTLPDPKSVSRFIQPSCPPYKYDSATACDREITENCFAESLYYGPEVHYLCDGRYAVDGTMDFTLGWEDMPMPVTTGRPLCERIGSECRGEDWCWDTFLKSVNENAGMADENKEDRV